MRRHHQYKPEGAKKLGAELKALLDELGSNQAELCGLLAADGVIVDTSTLGRFFNGKQTTNAHLIQAIARHEMIAKNYPLPENYRGGSLTDYFLDRISGNDRYFDTQKTSKDADVFSGKKSVNDAQRHGSDRPSESKTPIATIPKKSTKRSGVSVGIREGVKLLREAIGARSLADFSVLSGVPLSELEKIMEGNKKPDATDLARIGRVLKDLDVSALLQAYYSED